MTPRADAVVVGAGIVGVAMAYYLAERGLDTILIDRHGVAAGTSSCGEGNVLLSDKEPGPELELAKAGLAEWRRLRTLFGDRFEYEAKGGIVVAQNPQDLAALEKRAAIMAAAGVTTTLLDAQALQEAEPHLSPELPGALLFPDDAQVQPMLACAILAAAAKERGARLMLRTPVLAIERTPGGAVRGVRTNAGIIEAPRVILATGAWTPALCEPLRVWLPILPRKGHIVVTERVAPTVFHKVYESSYCGAVQSDDSALAVSSVVESTKSGTLLLGSSRELVGFDDRVDVRVCAEIVRRAITLFPSLERVRAVRSYVGFRPFVPDHLPIIGEVPAVAGLYVNAGHEGAGIGLGPVSARLLSERICGKMPALDLQRFSPARFTEAVTSRV